MEWLLIWVLSILVSVALMDRYKLGILGFFLGLFLGPLGMFISLLIVGGRRRCKSCDEVISAKAIKCPRCHAEQRGALETEKPSQ